MCIRGLAAEYFNVMSLLLLSFIRRRIWMCKIAAIRKERKCGVERELKEVKKTDSRK